MRTLQMFCLIGVSLLAGCGGGGGGGTVTPPVITVRITPANPNVLAGVNQTFSAAVTGTTNTGVTWSVQEGAAGGTISPLGVYLCVTPGTYHIVASSQARPTVTDTTAVTVQGGNVSGNIQ